MAELIKLICLLVFPMLLVTIVITFFFGGSESGYARLKHALTIHIDRGLSHQGLLWFGILIPISYFFAIGIVIWKGHHLLISQQGFQNFIEISKFPITLLSLTLPFSIIVASFNSSRQTAAQIKITQEKNNIDLFNSHRKELFSYFSQVGEVEYFDVIILKNVIHPRVHRNYFIGKPENGTPVINEASFDYLFDSFNSVKQLMDYVLTNKDPKMNYNLYVANICPKIWDIAKRLGVKEVLMGYEDRCVTVEYENGKYTTIGNCIDDVVVTLRCLNDFYLNLCDFAGYNRTVESEYYNNERKYFYFMKRNDFQQHQYSHIIDLIHLRIKSSNI